MFADRTRTRWLLPSALGMACVLCLCVAPLSARTPAQRDTILDRGDEAVLKPPIVVFRRALERIQPPIRPDFRLVAGKGAPAERTARADLADLRAALAERGVPEARHDELAKQYGAARTAILKYSRDLAAWQSRSGWRPDDDAQKKLKPDAPAVAVPGDVPLEFTHYLRGALAYHRGDRAAAIDAWQKVLNLPEIQRHYRSTWAAHMIGKVHLEAKPAEAAKSFARVRALAQARCADRLSLAADSYGWEALAELRQKHFARAAALYLAQLALRDPTAVESLRTVAHQAFKAGAEPLRAAARHEAARQVMTAYLVSYKQFIDDPWVGTSRAKLTAAWLKAMRDAGVENAASAADLAWLTYQAGDLDAATGWADKGDTNAPISQWVRAKLLLRKGDLDRAAGALIKALAGLPKKEAWQDVRDRISGELAALRMARREYVEALDLLLRAGFWPDAALVAERALTVEELVGYVDRHWPGDDEPEARAERTAAKRRPDRQARAIRCLLARRLARLGRRKEARGYFPADLRLRLDLYSRAIRDGRDAQRPKAEQALWLWRAAKLARTDGRRLMGVGFGRDPSAPGGLWRLRRMAGRRLAPATTKQVLVVTDDERRRLRRHAAETGKRCRYLYAAAEHAWSAALLMPNESDETARLLCEAGTWLKIHDPKAADRFYKAMVLRCGTTQLGQQADKRRWFPPLPR